MKKKYIGSNFGEFLKEESLLERSTTVAVIRSINWQIKRGMEWQKISNHFKSLKRARE